ncbi:MAG: 30S ribosomal protein S1 [Acidobacteriaceae bacterium]
MSNPSESSVNLQADLSSEENQSFGDQLSQFERSQPRNSAGNQQINGTVIAVSADGVFVDIGFKTEGILPLSIFSDAQAVTIGDRILVSVKGRNPEGYYELSRIRVEQPKDWAAMEKAFADRSVIAGTVTAVVKGGLTVDVGMRAFLPASRSGARDAAEMEKLVGQEIRCRITKLDVADEDVVIDRRSVTEEVDRANEVRRYAEVNVGDTLVGTVRSLTDFGAFLDLGGVDGLLHVGEISWARVGKAEDVLSLGQQIEVKILKIEPETRRISLSRKQLLPHPWDAVAEKYKVGDRVRGTVTRLADFGAFLELEPGVEGMIHISEMSWGKKLRTPGDMLTVGDTAEAVILGIDATGHRLSLGLKQALGDPWVDAAHRLAAGSVVEGEITSFTKFGAFLQLSEGIQGLVHISEISSEKRLNHPSDVLRLGERVKAKVLEFDKEKRQLRLSIKQMVPTGLDDFLAEHKQGDLVTGRILSLQGEQASVELGEGIIATCALKPAAEVAEQASSTGKVDLSSLTSLLSARWKSGESSPSSKSAQLAPGQIHSFRITEIDGADARISLERAV